MALQSRPLSQLVAGHPASSSGCAAKDELPHPPAHLAGLPARPFAQACAGRGFPQHKFRLKQLRHVSLSSYGLSGEAIIK